MSSSSSSSSASPSVTLKRKAGDNLPEQPRKRINRGIGQSILGGEPDSDEDAGVAPSRRPRASASQAKGRLQKAGGRTRQRVKEVASKAVTTVKKSVKKMIPEGDKANTQGPTNIPVKAAPRIIARVPIVPQQEQAAPPRPGWFEQYLPKPVKSSKVQPPTEVPAAVKPTTPEPVLTKPAPSEKPEPILAVQIQRDATGELSIEEVWAKSRGWTDVDWAAERKEAEKLSKNAVADDGARADSPSQKRKADEDINPLPPKKRASVEPEVKAGGSEVPSGAGTDAAVKPQKSIKAAKATKAGQVPAERPRKVRTGGSKVVYESKDEVPSNPPRHQIFVASDGPVKSERANEEKDDENKAGNQARLDKHAETQKASHSPAMGNGKAGMPAGPCEEAPKKTSLSLFESIQRPGQKPLAPKDVNIRIEKTPLGPPPQTARSSIKKKLAVSKASRRPGYGEELRVPKRLSTISAAPLSTRSTTPPSAPSTVSATASSTSPLVASSTTPPAATAASPEDAPLADASGAASTALSRAPSNASATASVKAPSAAPSTAPSCAPPKTPSTDATESSAGSSPKRKAEEQTGERAAKKPATDRAKVQAGEARGAPNAGVKSSGGFSPKRKAEVPADEPSAKKRAGSKPETKSLVVKLKVDASKLSAKKRAGSKPETKSLVVKLKVDASKLRGVLDKAATTITGAERNMTSMKDDEEQSNVAARITTGKGIDGNTGKAPTVAADDRDRALPETKTGLVNFGATCFANSIFQVFQAAEEFRDHLRSKQEEGKHRKKKSLTASLGSLFEKMGTAVRNRATESAQEFLKIFGGRHHGYDGTATQQEAFDFAMLLMRELEAEEAASSESTAEATSLVKRLFGVEKVTQEPFATNELSDYHCEECKAEGFSSRTQRIRSRGKYMLVNLPRGYWTAAGFSKIQTPISIPREVDLTQYMTMAPEELEAAEAGSNIQLKYDVVAYVVHDGLQLNHGHYRSYRKAADDAWYEFNDADVTRMEGDGHLDETEALQGHPLDTQETLKGIEEAHGRKWLERP
ncbi:MAG: hypothetical protein Q9208_008767 [Pyrenodesmia sp. 3 TL-2023]